MIFEGEARIDMRYVCPEDVKKMLLQQARTVYWKEWAAKHEHGDLKEGIWLEPALAVLRKNTYEEWTDKNIVMLRGSYFWKEAGCRNDSSTLVGLMKVNAKLVTRTQAQKSAGSTTAQNGTKSDGGFQMLSENGTKVRTTKEEWKRGIVTRIHSVKANGTRASPV